MNTYIGDLIAAVRETMQWGHSERPLLEIDTRIEDISLDMDRAISCGLIVNELLSNCFRHGTRKEVPEAEQALEAGRAQVTLLSDSGTTSLEVRDNGPGLPSGFDPDEASSLGMQVVLTMVGKLRGTLNAWNDGGAVFHVDFPLPT